MGSERSDFYPRTSKIEPAGVLERVIEVAPRLTVFHLGFCKKPLFQGWKWIDARAKPKWSLSTPGFDTLPAPP